jgi:uncharacterized protein
MLGISIYLNEPISDHQREYIHTMSNLGCRGIFTSLHIPEDDPSLYATRLKELGSLAKQYKMELVADISPQSLAYLGVTWEKAEKLKEWGITGLRVDYGLSEELIANLSRKMKIALNASTLTEENVNKLKQYNFIPSSVEAWHNFYPRPETGLDTKEFYQRNEWLKSEKLSVMAFIPGDGIRRGPLYKGLPTIEEHRDLTTFAAYLDFYHHPSVDKIFIGDPTICQSSAKQFAYFKDGTIFLRAHPFTDDKRIMDRFKQIQTNRLDAARDVIRSAESRLYGLMGDFSVEPYNTIDRPVGAITVDNRLYGRYQGEIQITKRSLEADQKVNVIGQVIKEDLHLLNYIRGGTKFMIEWNE